MTNKKTAEAPTLLPQHKKLMADSGISPEVADARGYRSVFTKAELRRLGFGEQQCKPGLLIPIWGVTGAIASYQLRPDTPRIGRRGKPLKYETPRGSRMVLDAHPLIRAQLGDPRVPLIVTEGVRKADSAVSRGLCCISLLGVWSWRGSNEFGGKTALSDWDQIALNGRTVYICFDSDVMINPAVHEAMSRLKDLLEARGAMVSFICLPHGRAGEKVGLDDYLANGYSTQQLFDLASSELRMCPGNDQPAIQYVATDAGIFWRKPLSDGTIMVQLTNFPARIASEHCEDDGVDTRLSFEIEATLNGRTMRFRVPVQQFGSMHWAIEHLGAGAVVSAGFGSRDRAREAIQILSDKVERRQVYVHTGWRKVDGIWVYLSEGGAIGPSGLLDGIEVRLPEGLSGYCLPSPLTGEDLASAIHASLRILDLAEDDITVPVFSAIWRAALGACDFSLHISGLTGTGKSELAALAQRHWGVSMDARHLPGSWSSTGNALEGMAFSAKDALFSVDDFCPTGSSSDVARLHREADRLFRAQGNNSGRQRMRSDATLKAAKPPRGLILSTGEDIPKGHSLRSRLLIVEVSPKSIRFDRLSACQKDAAHGFYSAALAGFVRWVAPQYTSIQARLRSRVTELRQNTFDTSAHRRTPETVANLKVSLDLFLEFAVEVGALTIDQAAAFHGRAWAAIDHAAAKQSQHQDASDPALRFLSLINAAVTSGGAYVSGTDGLRPENAQAWGWRKEPAAYDSEWRPMGKKIGWLDGGDLYLEPDASYAAAERMALDTGGSIGITPRTLHMRLKDKGLLVNTEDARTANRVRKTLEGFRRTVLHLRADSILRSVTDQTDHSGEDEREQGQNSGQLAGQFVAEDAPETDPQNCPDQPRYEPGTTPEVSSVSSDADRVKNREVFDL